MLIKGSDTLRNLFVARMNRQHSIFNDVVSTTVFNTEQQIHNFKVFGSDVAYFKVRARCLERDSNVNRSQKCYRLRQFARFIGSIRTFVFILEEAGTRPS
jgi:hypothetical protein